MKTTQVFAYDPVPRYIFRRLLEYLAEVVRDLIPPSNNHNQENTSMKGFDTPIDVALDIILQAHAKGKRVVYRANPKPTPEPTQCQRCGTIAAESVCHICKQPK